MSRRRTSLVDLGSNSARLVVYEYEPTAGLQLIDEIREVIRLGEGVARSGRLSSNGIGRAVAALRAFEDYARATGLPDVRIMATSAVRSAANGCDLIERVEALGVTLEVLSGEAEAALGVLAVANTARCSDAWVVDLGGGSVQLSCMRRRRYDRGGAYPFGAISATEGFLHSDPPTAREIAALEAAVEAQVGPALHQARGEDLPLVAMGGTVRNLAAAVQKRSGYPWRAPHAYRLDATDLDDLTRELVARTAAERGRIPGINAYRADIITAGALVLRCIARLAGVRELVISGFGMREGALYQELLEPPYLVTDIRRFSVENLLWRYPQLPQHTARVVALSEQLFDALAPLHGRGGQARELLGHAAMLHDIGKAIHHRNHDKHGAYLVASSPLPGFDHREQALLSLLVRYHRRGWPVRAPYQQLLSEADGRLLAELTVCLRLAEHLDRSRTGRVKGIRAQVHDGDVALDLLTSGEAWVEFWETQKQAPLFEAVFEHRLRLEVVSV